MMNATARATSASTARPFSTLCVSFLEQPLSLEVNFDEMKISINYQNGNYGFLSTVPRNGPR